MRDEDEFAEAHIPGSVHLPYGELPERQGELPRDRAIAAICSGGKRSGLAASILQREGFDRVMHVANGGVGTWRRSGRPVEERLGRRRYFPSRSLLPPPSSRTPSRR